MNSKKTLIVSHAPFWHDGSGIPERSYHTIIAALPAAIAGIAYYGAPALGVICMAMSTAILWELLLNRAMRRPITVGDGNAALIGLLLGMMLPASTPWWVVLVGTFLAIVIGMQIFGGIGANPFNPVVLAIAILMISYKGHLDFDAGLVNFSLDFPTTSEPLAALKAFGPAAVEHLHPLDLLMGRQVGGLGSANGLALVIGGIYLMIRGIIRWEVCVSFIVGTYITAMLFNMADPSRFADPVFHLLTGYTLFGAFFLATESTTSPVNFVPMLIYGTLGGVMTVLIRNIGIYVDGVIFAILLINLINPLVDKIRPKAIGKVA
ncbi:RnfABCDGE type electron transport complex subunit D [Desulfosarcina ovata]|uniref:Electron transport complex subunit D n=2 Tax=Desulfosarcina ovata TaxID=83564 RepID=A0A5K8AL74_9BACT|nr:RnfABCDGE type electron transport complex subunit D [Desulfosarcina ovata]BBO85515.1 electron transport complex subunit D [Desulfosarcina ovata subsp. sediminis]BBO92550.1 electron transport complex subunit D [Desulfosarcina ovata subsp. ovata]